MNRAMRTGHSKRLAIRSMKAAAQLSRDTFKISWMASFTKLAHFTPLETPDWAEVEGYYGVGMTPEDAVRQYRAKRPL